jgi:hypothetical protein
MPNAQYLLWNMKNLSVGSLSRQFSSFATNSPTLHQNIVAYTNTILYNYIDIACLLEITVLTGEAGIQALVQALGVNYTYAITSKPDKHMSRLGTYTALILNRSKFNLINSTEENFDKSVTVTISSSQQETLSFTNRVPVLFKVPLTQNANSILQIISWHAPAPGDINPGNDLRVLKELIKLYTTGPNPKINTNQPIVISGDFNFNTDTSAANQYADAWKNIFDPTAFTNLTFKGLFNGHLSTLVKKPTTNQRRNIPVTFDELLANAYDNIIISNKITATNPFGVINHIKTEVVGPNIALTYFNLTELALIIKSGNKISDHCAVGAELQF